MFEWIARNANYLLGCLKPEKATIEVLAECDQIIKTELQFAGTHARTPHWEHPDCAIRYAVEGLICR